MYVLVACEESQRVCIEFRKRGHIAFSCDLQECSGGHPEWHIDGDVVPLLGEGCHFLTQDGKFHYVPKWDLLIAHPPCTYLSKAGARWLYKGGLLDSKRYTLGLAAKNFFMVLLDCNISNVCIENPTPLKIFELPECSQVVQPYMFGEPYSKRTCLWLRGSLKLLVPTDVVVPVDTYCPSNCSNYKKGSKGSKGAARRSKEDGKERAKTFIGLARAMAEQWG